MGKFLKRSDWIVKLSFAQKLLGRGGDTKVAIITKMVTREWRGKRREDQSVDSST